MSVSGSRPATAETIGVGEAESIVRKNPQLRFRDDTGTHVHDLSRRMVLGSAPGSDIVIAHPTVSKLHAELDPRPDGLWVRDLGSRNGTTVAGIRAESARVPDNGVVRVGAVELYVTYDTPALPVELWPHENFGPLIGPSLVMRELFAQLARIAASDATVLIEGETGTGKELAARALHDASPRADQPFVVVDCGALPETLLEAELFGYVRGAFTGADTSREGALEAATGGTVFLDEIGELPLAMQPKLLRALESRQIRRLGESRHRDIDVRFVSATHRDLRTMVNTRAFREDLYFRLAVLPVRLPPLRERLGDAPALVAHFLTRMGRPNATLGPDLGPDFDRELMTRPWLGNIRELRNFVERALTLGTGPALAMTGATGVNTRSALGAAADGVNIPPWLLAQPLNDARDAWQDLLERAYIQNILARHDRNISAAASAAGLNRTYLHRLIRKHGL